MEQNTSLAVSEPKQAIKPYIPSLDTIASMEKMCQLAARSNFLTSSAPMSQIQQREADAFFVAMYGLELGVPFITSLRMIYVIDGKPACASQLLLGLMLKHGVKVVMPNPGTVTDSATITIQRPNSPAHDYTYTKDMAVAAGLWGNKKNWKSSPREMLIWRAVAMGGRMECPDIVGGLYSLEELAPDSEVDSEGALVGNVVTSTARPSITVEPEEIKDDHDKEEIKHDPDEWINGNVSAFVAKWTGHGMTAPQIMQALKITERWGNWKGTVSEADAAVEAYRKPASVPPEVAAAKVTEDADLRAATLNELENQLVHIYHVEKRDYVRGTGKAAGQKWLAKANFFDSTEHDQKIEFMLFPEDVDAIRKAGHDFPQKDAEVYIPVTLTIKERAIRIKNDKVAKKDTTPADPSQQLFDSMNDVSEAAHNQFEHA